MKPQHLSDQAVAAFADGVLSGSARERARRHTADCPECAYAVAVQREAVWALRAAPAPALPTGLLDRLREVPVTTPISMLPTTLAADGSTLLASFGTMATAALVPSLVPAQTSRRGPRLRPLAATAAAVAVAGVVAVGSAAPATSAAPARATTQPSQQVQFQQVSLTGR